MHNMGNLRLNYMTDSFPFSIQGVSQKGKKFCVLRELGNKTQPGVLGTMTPSVGSEGNQGTEPSENVQFLAEN